MTNQKDPNAKEGMRVRLVSMVDDPNPITAGTEGTIRLVDDAGIIHVNWDNGRTLGLIPGVDDYILEPALENYFNKIDESDSGKTAIKTAIKKTPSAVNKSMPKPTKMSSSVKSSLKSSGIKTGQVTKNFKSADISDIKVESEDNIDEMTGAGGVATGAASSSGAYVGPMGATKPTFGKGPLTKKKGVSKPGPLHPQKVKENVFTKAQLIRETTTTEIEFDDDSNDPWADKNRDGWKWNDNPAFHPDGVIVDPLAKMNASWDDSNLDISKEWDKYQNKLKKEDILRMIKNRLNESKNTPPPIEEEEEQIEETTTFGSVFGTGFPVVPAFAAKKGQWRTSKKPIWKGGKIVQQIENSGVLNPVNEANTVKYNKSGKFVKIKKKCTKFPYCSQGAIDNPLKLSNNVTEPGTYVEEQLMKNIHEVAKQTGKSFDEVYQIVKTNLGE